LEALQALVDILPGGMGELDMVDQEDDALAGDAFLASAEGGIEDYGVVESKRSLIVGHRPPFPDPHRGLAEAMIPKG
jgi:hypothetical protein